LRMASLCTQSFHGIYLRPARGIAMLGAPLQGLQNEHVESSLRKLNPVQVWLAAWSHSVETLPYQQVEGLLGMPSP
jgi:hypothetical protein